MTFSIFTWNLEFDLNEQYIYIYIKEIWQIKIKITTRQVAKLAIFICVALLPLLFYKTVFMWTMAIITSNQYLHAMFLSCFFLLLFFSFENEINSWIIKHDKHKNHFQTPLNMVKMLVWFFECFYVFKWSYIWMLNVEDKLFVVFGEIVYDKNDQFSYAPEFRFTKLFRFDENQQMCVLTLRCAKYDWTIQTFTIQHAPYSMVRQSIIQSSNNHPDGDVYSALAHAFLDSWLTFARLQKYCRELCQSVCTHSTGVQSWYAYNKIYMRKWDRENRVWISGVSMHGWQKKENEFWCGVCMCLCMCIQQRSCICVRLFALGWHSQLTSSDRKLMSFCCCYYSASSLPSLHFHRNASLMQCQRIRSRKKIYIWKCKKIC